MKKYLALLGVRGGLWGYYRTNKKYFLMQFKIVLLTVLLTFTKSFLFAKSGDTLHVVTHYRTTVVTDPSKGFKIYKRWGQFPSADAPIRKIIMHVNLGCPDSMRCGEWDYLDRITIARTGGQNGKVQDFEIGRMLTPYGGNFKKNWKFEWEVDVTDFSSILRDSVEIEYYHSGFESNKGRGWAITIDFEIIKGKPSVEPISIQKIYDGQFVYGDRSKPVEEFLKPVTFTASPNASFARLRIVQTGHGMNDNDNCGEFCSKNRQIWYDGKLIDTRAIWKKCGDNPLYPQAGTWIFDRANWCPGNLMQPDSYDLAVNPRKTHTVQASMEKYVTSTPTATEVISAYLIQYKKATIENDASIEDVAVPSLKTIYQRQNPAVANPQIVVKNVGSNELKTLLVQYGTTGFAKKQFQWNGKISSGKSETITLPGLIDMKQVENQFSLEILKTNGKKDGYADDNNLSIPFKSAPIHGDSLIFYLRTNNQPEQNAYILYNSEGKVINERKLGSLLPNTIYRDTLKLAPGAYSLALIDTAGDGLEFWYNDKGGRGMARLLNTRDEMIKNFESNCGTGWIYNFKVDAQPEVINNNQTSIGLFPNRTKDKTTVDYFGNIAEDVLVQLVTEPDGKIMEEHNYPKLKEGLFTYDLSRYPNGDFFLKVIVNGKEKYKRFILKE